MLPALITLPISAHWAPQGMLSATSRFWLTSWLCYDFLPSLFLVALIASAIAFLYHAVRRRWRRLPQQCIEMFICLLSAFVLPAY